jgi:predicted nucleotidyltransferase component of viral defense system
MSNPNPTNFVASVEAKLKNFCKQQNIDYRFALIRYANERFLYRLSVSEYAKQFILKGGNLFIIWQKGKNFRPTVDSDFLYSGQTDEAHFHNIFASLCESQTDEKSGLHFDTNTIKISAIRQAAKYVGTRISLMAFLGNAQIPLQFDIGIGDAITPPPEYAEFPVLLNGAIPRLRIYPKETAISEKFEAMVTKGDTNSRMKDFYDIWLLAMLFDFDFNILQQAIRNTFSRHGVPLPTATPECFTEAFCRNPIKQTQWKAFCRKNNISQLPESFEAAVSRIKDFLEPVYLSPESPFETWLSGKGWQ